MGEKAGDERACAERAGGKRDCGERACLKEVLRSDDDDGVGS